MLEKNESIEHIKEWSKKHEAEVNETDVPVEDFQNRINELKEGENEKRKAGKNQIEEERLQRRPDEEKGLETMKTDPRQTFQLKIERNSG